MWNRKNSVERRIDSLERSTATAVEDLADTVRQRFDNEAGQQLAGNLAQLARNIDHLELGDTMARRRKELERATKKATRQVNRALRDLEKTRGKVARDANALAARVGESVEHGGQQLATIGQKAVPSEPTGWVMPTLLGFLLG
ncbi:MAG TPA: hypothetical protein PKD53_25870, partial [Chloroflexaceae bacterium]|nr:hypothetical protein [Chloroflexaceae bacterium]